MSKHPMAVCVLQTRLRAYRSNPHKPSTMCRMLTNQHPGLRRGSRVHARTRLGPKPMERWDQLISLSRFLNRLRTDSERKEGVGTGTPPPPLSACVNDGPQASLPLICPWPPSRDKYRFCPEGKRYFAPTSAHMIHLY